MAQVPRAARRTQGWRQDGQRALSSLGSRDHKDQRYEGWGAVRVARGQRHPEDQRGTAPLLAFCLSSGPSGLGLTFWTSGGPGLQVWAWGVGDGSG